MSLSVRTRFEVFKRDRFTCGYCGNHPPDVLLEVDHVTPRAAGGTDAIENLVTACWDCNHGKSDRLLDEGGRPAVSKRTVAALEERLEQARAYVELLGALSTMTESMLGQIQSHWAQAFGAILREESTGSMWYLDHGTWPKDATLRIFLRDLPLDEILAAIDAAASRIGDASGNDRYFYAICWRRIRDKRAAELPIDTREVDGLRADNLRLHEELASQQEVVDDLRLNIRRLREQAERE